MGIMIKKFEWHPKHTIFNDEMDEQHKQFFHLCNELIDLLEKDGPIDKEEALVLVSKIGNYAFYHFGLEEELFQQTTYPKVKEHIRAHKAFRDAFDALAKKVNDPDRDLRETLEELVVFSGEWIKNHIITIDKEYTEYL